MLASYQREGACPGLCFASECCPWRFSSCSRLLAHQLFNSLQPCGLQPRVLVFSEHTSLGRGCVWKQGWVGGCGAEAGQRNPSGKQSRGMGNRSHQLHCWAEHFGQHLLAQRMSARGLGSSSNLLR